MKFNTYFKKFTFFSVLLLMTAFSVFAQTPNLTEPREEKLLNGTKLLVWNDPKADKVVVKIRIHSGSAFDPQGKEGTMQLLSDILFPNDSTREFFTDDLGGNLEVIMNYDYIQINASGTSDKFLTILETLAPAVTNPQINKETTEKVRAALLLKVKELEKNPSYVADQAVAKRLFGNFPYGRPQLGSAESVAKIDFADILLADQKFLTADNATIAISGNVKPDFALRATKRLFGGWLKADKKIPATFAQPAAPNTEPLRIEKPEFNISASYLAIRWLARNDKDLPAAQLFNMVMSEKTLTPNPIRNKGFLFIPHLLNGVLIHNIYTEDGNTKIDELKPINLRDALSISVNQTDFDKGKELLMTNIKNRLNNRESLIDWWLDSETYKLPTIAEQMRIYNSISLADVQRVEARLQKEPIVSVFVTKSTGIIN